MVKACRQAFSGSYVVDSSSTTRLPPDWIQSNTLLTIFRIFSSTSSSSPFYMHHSLIFSLIIKDYYY